MNGVDADLLNANQTLSNLIPVKNGDPRTFPFGLTLIRVHLTPGHHCGMGHFNARKLSQYINLILDQKKFLVFLRKEVISRRFPTATLLRLHPVADHTVVGGISSALRCNQLPWCDGLLGNIHRGARSTILAIQTSCIELQVQSD